jgi:peptidoglycan/xylan/chitin deacetylase (PgdA/CDA1 family)
MDAALPQFGRVHLTFDDGPDPAWTPRCLEYLADANARATFFVIGANAAQQRSLVRRIAAEGHAIGNHTLTHAHPWTINSRRARAEVRDGAKVIADILGFEAKFFRPPHGARRRCMLDEAQSHGQSLVMWDVSAIDWGWLGTAPRIAKRLASAPDGSIILMHDGANQHNRPDQLLSVLPDFLKGVGTRVAAKKE